MKKLLAVMFLTLAVLAVHAQNVAVLLSGQATNSTIKWGSTSAVVLNRLLTTQSLTTAAAGSSNLAYVVTNWSAYAPGSTVGMVARYSRLSAPGTNTYTLQRAVSSAGPWEAWTNVSLAALDTIPVSANFILSIGEYHYFKVSDITNAAGGTCQSNYISFHQK